MKISSIVGKDKLTLSFEVFPPKTDSDFEKVKEAAFGVAAIKPAYISVTYGAGGSTSTNTLAIAKGIQENMVLQQLHILHALEHQKIQL